MALLKLTPTDKYETATSRLQHDTEEELLKHLPSHPENKDASKDAKPSTVLQKQKHMQFLIRNLMGGFGSRYVSQDASQPWLLFWTLQSFSCLGVVLDPGNKQRVIDKVMRWQHPDGGFGGGPGQAAHLLTTYASVCILSMVGRPGPGGGWDDIDRKKVYEFFMSLKQPDGSFLVSHHAEVDVRGIYCLLVVAILLDILTPELVEGTAEFVASCQTYEGGFASSSFPTYFPTSSPSEKPTPIPGPRPALGEAHGGYTFCALAAWVLLQPYVEAAIPNPSDRPTINLKNLTRWLVQLQGTESELGGFKGRTNKLVDGCYAWWCGGSFGLLEALGVNSKPLSDNIATEEDSKEKSEEEWDDFDDGLFNSKALQEYVLLAGQHPSGGLRDKPPKPADAYHTLYCLAGLSSAQHRIFPSKHKCETFLNTKWKDGKRKTDLGLKEEVAELDDRVRKDSLAALVSWSEDPMFATTFWHIVGGKENRINATHPITNLTVTHTEDICRWAYGYS
ncbi:farnesyltransferase subunit beta [Coprinopsis cinerea AmutBmut pab1-1]|nr:farnesyltransferase subunit beta [Coprinopsis cinerea AmutBmut pab1-1]